MQTKRTDDQQPIYIGPILGYFDDCDSNKYIHIYMSLNRKLSQKSLDESCPDDKYFFALILIRTKYFLCDRIC